MTNTFNSDNQQTGSNFIYDGNGNPTNSTLYDPENRMTSYGNGRETYTYDGDGLRTQKSGTYFLYDGEQPVGEYGGTGGLRATNTFGADGLLSRTAPGTPNPATTLYTFDERGNVCSRLQGPRAMPSTDAYDAFGTRISQSVYSQPDPWGFGAQEGYYTDTAQSGLILCTHRYYDPAKGRFLTRDPLGYGGGVNLYGYTGNNPVNESDPRGLSTYGGGLNGTITFGPIVVGISGGFKGDDNGTVGLSCNVFTVCRFPPGLPGVSPAVNYSPGNLPVDGNGITSISGGLSSGPVVYLPPVGIVNSTPCSGGPPTISVFPGVQSPGIGYVVSAGGTVGINGNGLENTVNQGIGQWYGPGWFGDSGE